MCTRNCNGADDCYGCAEDNARYAMINSDDSKEHKYLVNPLTIDEWDTIIGIMLREGYKRIADKIANFINKNTLR